MGMSKAPPPSGEKISSYKLWVLYLDVYAFIIMKPMRWRWLWGGVLISRLRILTVLKMWLLEYSPVQFMISF